MSGKEVEISSINIDCQIFDSENSFEYTLEDDGIGAAMLVLPGLSSDVVEPRRF